MKKKILAVLLVFAAFSFWSCAQLEDLIKTPSETSQGTAEAPSDKDNAEETPPGTKPGTAEAPSDNDNAETIETSIDLVREMGLGWNLGNTLDANPLIDNPYGNRSLCTVATETSWGLPKTTEAMIKGLADSGIKTVRIPVSWSDHISNPDKDYKIDSVWMNRVKQIVGWVIDNDMFAIVNIHHDNFYQPTDLRAGYGYYPSYTFEKVSVDFVTEVWKQIAKAFKDYDNHLIFETLNEPRLRGHSHEWNYQSSSSDCQKAMEIINKMNQAAVDTIRAAGGKNATRLIMVPSYVASPDSAFAEAFQLPQDIAKMLAVSVHMYSPYEFAMLDNSKGGTSAFTEAHKNGLKSTFDRLKSTFIDKGYPVIIGEFGATNKDNLSDRVEWFKFFVSECTSRSMCPVLWDNNAPFNSDPQECFGFYNRENLTWYFPEILEAMKSSVNYPNN